MGKELRRRKDGRYQNFLHDDEGGSTFPAEVTGDVLPRSTRMVKLCWFAGRILETARREDSVGGIGSAFMLTICAVTDGGHHRLGREFEFDGTAKTRSVENHYR
jgi:hypothetical protein